MRGFGVRRIVVGFLGIALLLGRIANGQNSGKTALQSFSAIDLSHNTKSGVAKIQRTWNAGSGAMCSFGPGWGDENNIRLTLVDVDAILLWRGGAGWRLFHNLDGKWSTLGGEMLTRSAEGSLYKSRSGDSYNFDKDGNLTGIEASGGASTSYSYDSSGRISEIAFGSGTDSSLKYFYDGGTQRVAKVTGPEGLSAEYKYDSAGRLESVRNAVASVSHFKYVADGTLESVADDMGNVTKTADLMVEEKPAKSPQAAKQRAMEYLQQPKAGVASQGSEDVTQTDAYGRPVEVRRQDGKIKKIQYNPLGLPTTIEHYDGNKETLKYDQHGRLARSSDAFGGWSEFEYDEQGRLAALRQAPGKEIKYVYDDKGRVTEERHSNGLIITNKYDEANNSVTRSSTAAGDETSKFDSSGNLIEKTTRDGLKTTYTFDNAGRISSYEDSVHGKTTVEYGADGRTKTFSHPKAGKTVNEEGSYGKLYSVTTPAGQKTKFAYDGAGDPKSVTAASGTYNYRHDSKGRLTEVTSPRGFKSSLSYDDSGKVSSISRGEVTWRRFQYDDGGNVIEIRTPKGLAARYSYANGKTAKAELPSGTFTWKCRPDGLAVMVQGPGCTFTETFNDDGSLATRECKESGLKLALPLDKAGRSAGIQLGNLKAFYDYNSAGRVAKITLPDSKAISLKYDEAGRPIKFDFGGVATAVTEYDFADRPTSVKSASAGKELFSRNYTYDKAGNITQVGTSKGSAVFTYDQSNRLTTWHNASNELKCEYDSDGNLLAKTTPGGSEMRWKLDEDGRPSKGTLIAKNGRISQRTCDWDSAGNLTGDGADKTKRSLEYNALGQLIKITGTGKPELTFGYYPSGDRLWKAFGRDRTWYEYTDSGLAGVKEADGTIWLVINVPGTDWPLALCGSNGKTYFVMSDQSHSTRRVIDDKGANVASYDFAPYGEIIGTNGKCPVVMFAGMLNDGAITYYARQRYYNASIGRFFSIDSSIGNYLHPATHNAYMYAAGNPIRYRDPMGASIREMMESPLVDYLTPEELEVFDATAADAAAFSGAAAQNAAIAARVNMQKQVLERFLARAATRQAGQAAASGSVESAITLGGANSAAAGTGATASGATGAGSAAAASQNAAVGAGAAESAAAGVTASTAGAASAGTTGGGTVGAAAANAAIAAEEVSTVAAPVVAAGTVEAGGVLGAGGAGAGGAGAAGLAAAAAPVVIVAGTSAAVLGGVGYGVYVRPAQNEANAAENAATAMGNSFEGLIKKKLKDNPAAFAPALGGKIPDPNNPDDVAKILQKLNQNLNDGKKSPVDGIIDEAAMIRDQLDAARPHLNAAIAAHESAEESVVIADKKDEDAMDSLKTAVQTAGLTAVDASPLAGFTDAAKNVANLTTDLNSRAAGWQTAQSDLDRLAGDAAKAAEQICALANATEAKTKDSDVVKSTADAIALLDPSKNSIEAAQMTLADADAAANKLQSAMDNLRGYQTAYNNAKSATGVGSQQVALQTAISDAKKNQADAAALDKKSMDDRAKAMSEAKQVLTILGQYKDKVVEAGNLCAQAEELLAEDLSSQGGSLLDSALDSLGNAVGGVVGNALLSVISAAQTILDNYNKSLKDSLSDLEKVDLSKVLSDADAALKATQGFAKADVDSAAQAALDRGVACLAQLDADMTLIGKAGGSSTAKGEVEVPDLSVFSNVSEMIAAIKQNNLKPSMQKSNIKPPDKDSEFKLQAQSPPAGTKVMAGATVTAYIYQKLAAEPGSVPNVYGMTLADAQATLEGAGFKVAGVDVETPPNKENADKVISQDPPAGSTPSSLDGKGISLKVFGPYKLEGETGVTAASTPGTEILPPVTPTPDTGQTPTGTIAGTDGSNPESNPLAGLSGNPGLTALGAPVAPTSAKSKPSPGPAVMPNILKLSVADATAKLAGAGVSEPIFVDSTIKTPSKGDEFMVAEQFPAAGTPLTPSTDVGGKIYKAFASTEDNPSQVPSIIGMTADSAQGKLAKWNMSLGSSEVGGKPPDAEHANCIYVQNPVAGSPVIANGTVSVKVYGSFKNSGASPPPDNPANTSGNGSGGTSSITDTEEDDITGTWKITITGQSPATCKIIKNNGQYYVANPADPKSQPMPFTRSGASLSAHKEPAKLAADGSSGMVDIGFDGQATYDKASDTITGHAKLLYATIGFSQDLAPSQFTMTRIK